MSYERERSASGRAPDGRSWRTTAPISDPGIQPPRELLTTRVDELVAAVNALTGVPPETACPADGGPRLAYWSMYPDGDARAVVFELFGCDVLRVGDEVRSNGDRVARLFAEALLEQREAASVPPGTEQQPGCRGLWSEGATALPIDSVDLRTATACAWIQG